MPSQRRLKQVLYLLFSIIAAIVLCHLTYALGMHDDAQFTVLAIFMFVWGYGYRYQ